MKMVRTSKRKVKVKTKINGCKCKSREKTKIKRIEVNKMSVVIEKTAVLAPMARMKHKCTSFSEMVFDKQKRQETYAYYDQNYEETEDEKEIFRIMSSRRRCK